jgi:hypothetical protein
MPQLELKPYIPAPRSAGQHTSPTETEGGHDPRILTQGCLGFENMSIISFKKISTKLNGRVCA